MNIADRNCFWAGFIIGLGFIGAVDGIVFHQFLQWHHLIDHHDNRLEIITDGAFNVLVTLLLLWGTFKVFVSSRNHQFNHNWGLFLSSILVGGGTFNIIEGLVNHHLLQLHHVKPGDPNEFLYDAGFIAVGIILFAIGIYGTRKAIRNPYTI